MFNDLIFINAARVWPIILGGTILLAVFIWKEWSQSGSRRIILKMMLALLAVSSLVFLALKPALPTKRTAGKMVLLTEGYNEAQLDSLRQEYKKLQVLEYDPSSFRADKLVASEEVFVLGHGVKEYDLWQLENAAVNYLGGNPAEGIVKLNYEPENFVADSLELKGLYRHPAAGNRLILQGPGGAGLDSVNLIAGESMQFKLAAELKVQGNYVFSLVEKDSLGIVHRKDPVPVKVAEKDNLKILVVNSFPTFETRYLKNFLAEAGNEVMVRSRITRGRFKYEYFNTERTPIATLSAATLKELDLLILDGGSLRNLSASEKSAVENEVRENGLGVFIQPDETFINSSGRLNVLNFQRMQGVDITLSQWPGINFNSQPYKLQDEIGVQPIHSTGDAIVTAYRRVGQGRVGTTVLSETYELLLEGNTTTYNELWSQVVESIGKKAAPTVEWQQQSFIAFKDEPFDITIRTTYKEPVIKTNGKIIPVIQDVYFPTTWKGTTWPRKFGWNILQQDTLGVLDFYVADQFAWRSLTAFETAAINRRHFMQTPTAAEGYFPLVPISPFWFFGLFLISMGGLWLEPKI